MANKNKPIVEILPTSEADLVPKLEAANLQAMLDRMVRERVDEILAERGAALLEPDFQPREVSYEVQRRQTVFERRKWSLYFEKWGCRRCDTKTVSHANGGYCAKCHTLFCGRLSRIRRDYDKANPEKEIERNIDRISSKIRSARMLLVESDTGKEMPPLLPSPLETTRLSHRQAVSAYRTHNIAAGNCAYCPRPLAPNSVHYCVEHLAQKRERKRKRREEFKARLRAVIDHPTRRARPELAVDSARIASLRAEGRSVRAIAAELGCSPAFVHKAVHKTPVDKMNGRVETSVT